MKEVEGGRNEHSRESGSCQVGSAAVQPLALAGDRRAGGIEREYPYQGSKYKPLEETPYLFLECARLRRAGPVW
jgi:hypothetical protein